jgi:phosphoribosyl 1,2-cyclic phosphodiesterase
VRLCVLASGSSGNAIYVQQGATRILIDAGITAREIDARLRAIDVDIRRLNALFVSHEHADHAACAGVLARKLRVPIYMTEGTFQAARRLFRGRERLRLIDSDQTVSAGELQVRAFPVPHDAADPVCFLVEGGSSSVGIATDLGAVTKLVHQRLAGADLVVLEANYDRDLPMGGPYPWALKQRISGNRGHLGNGPAAQALTELARGGLRQAILAHLSDENNRPDLARTASEDALALAGVRGFALSVAGPDEPTPTYIV